MTTFKKGHLALAQKWRKATGTSWTVKRLRQSDELAVLVQGIALANHEMSVRAIGGQLKVMKLKTPSGNATWSPTSVSHLLKKSPPNRNLELR